MNNDEASIRNLLAAQVTAWNRGDIAGYMHGYWESDSLLFIGKRGPRYGFTETLRKYREAYPDTAHTGRLTSVVQQVRKLSPEYYFIEGSWALHRSVGDVSGYYTLLLRRINGQWVIVVDHSS